MTRILSGIVVTLTESPAISLVAKGTIVVTLGLISTWLARRSRAAVRHALLASAFQRVARAAADRFHSSPRRSRSPVPVIAKGESNIWPLFDNTSAPSSGESGSPDASAQPLQKSRMGTASAEPPCCYTDGSRPGTALFHDSDRQGVAANPISAPLWPALAAWSGGGRRSGPVRPPPCSGPPARINAGANDLRRSAPCDHPSRRCATLEQTGSGASSYPRTGACAPL